MGQSGAKDPGLPFAGLFSPTSHPRKVEPAVNNCHETMFPVSFLFTLFFFPPLLRTMTLGSTPIWVRVLVVDGGLDRGACPRTGRASTAPGQLA
jgi:hypothetical protein